MFSLLKMMRPCLEPLIEAIIAIFLNMPIETQLQYEAHLKSGVTQEVTTEEDLKSEETPTRNVLFLTGSFISKFKFLEKEIFKELKKRFLEKAAARVDHFEDTPLYRMLTLGNLENFSDINLALCYSFLKKRYGHIVSIKNEDMTKKALKKALQELNELSQPFDIIITAHGSEDKIVFAKDLDHNDIKKLGRFEHLDHVFLQSCHGAAFAEDFIKIGAKSVSAFTDWNNDPFFAFLATEDLKNHVHIKEAVHHVKQARDACLRASLIGPFVIGTYDIFTSNGFTIPTASERTVPDFYIEGSS